jgi:hypothetical protein
MVAYQDGMRVGVPLIRTVKSLLFNLGFHHSGWPRFPKSHFQGIYFEAVSIIISIFAHINGL